MKKKLKISEKARCSAEVKPQFLPDQASEKTRARSFDRATEM